MSGQTTIFDLPLMELCENNIVLNQLIWPRPITFEKFRSYCSLMDGVIPIIYKNSQINEIYKEGQALFLSAYKKFPNGFIDKTRPSGIRCFASINSDPVIDFWSGMKWNQVARKWYSPFNPLGDFSEFNEAILEDGYNCGYIYDSIFTNSPCDRNFPCGRCEIQEDKLILLKGFCETGYDIFDMKFYAYGLRNNRPYFK